MNILDLFSDVLDDAFIEWTEEGKDIYTTSKSTKEYKHETSIKKLKNGQIHCSNRVCKKGGFEVDTDVIREMTSKNETKSKEQYVICSGYEILRPRKGCLNAIRYRITLKYK